MEIMRKADRKMRGNSSYSEMVMTIVRPEWSREVAMRSWAKGNDFALILITSPARDEGTVFLKRDKEIWNWQPRIERSIKMPPSMMMQSWMGSDFTNDDLVRESSVVEDYEHTYLALETYEDRACHKIKLVPKPETAVVWDRVITWVDTEFYVQLKSEFYDELGDLQHTIYGKEVGEMGGRVIPTVMEVIPEDEEGHLTRISYKSIDFDIPIEDGFFSLQQMKRIGR